MAFDGPHALEARQLSAMRGHVTLFQHVSFAIRSGETLLVTGPNGSGKTTLLRTIAGLTAPSHGEVRWQDRSMRPFAAELREAIAFNGHLPALKDELTPVENLAGWIALDEPAPAPEAIAEALDTFSLTRQRDLPVRFLSQGQRRRIALARLRLVRRPLWILDEPLTALDAEGAAALGALLDEHRASGGLCVAASHQPLPAARDVHTLALGAAAAP